jgi:uncharacterized SAM-binding protein YcdF (DUF218 family)
LLIYPLSLSLLLLLLALLLIRLRHVRSGFYTALLAVAWLYLCSTSMVASLLMDRLERGFPSRAMSAVDEVDAIVLLGGAMRGDAHMGRLPDLNRQADRLVHATALYKAGKAPLILLTGGGPPGDRTEAQQMRDILVVMGVPQRAMLLENQSRDTHDNAVYSAILLQGKGLRRVLLVTSAFHMRRAQALFAAQGLDVVPAPTDFQRVVSNSAFPGGLPQVSNLARTTHALHELAGYWVYRWRGWL